MPLPSLQGHLSGRLCKSQLFPFVAGRFRFPVEGPAQAPPQVWLLKQRDVTDLPPGGRGPFQTPKRRRCGVKFSRKSLSDETVQWCPPNQPLCGGVKASSGALNLSIPSRITTHILHLLRKSTHGVFVLDALGTVRSSRPLS